MSYAILLGAALDAVSAGLERSAVVARVHELEAKGATPKEIAEAIRNMAVASETDAQAAIDKAQS